MSDLLSDWSKLLGDFQSSVSKDLNEIRKHKAEIQQMKTELFDRCWAWKIIRDDQRVIISAPEIVIGNVDANGDLSADGGTVIIKGSALKFDGVGEDGIIASRAATISQTAVDPGIDGVEEVAHPTSTIVSQARNIVLQSNDSKDCFSQAPETNNKGIRIHSDTTMEIDTSVSAENRNQEIQRRLAKLNSEVVTLNLQTTQAKVQIDAKMVALKALMETHSQLDAKVDLTRVNVNALYELQ